MSKIGVFVGEKGNDSFCRDILGDLRSHHDVVVFHPKAYSIPLLYGRLNRWAYRHGIRSILRRSDVAFFEWASEVLEEASLLPKYCPIVVRLHSYELYTWTARIDWNKVDRIILVSEAIRKEFNAAYPEHTYKTVVVSNAVRLDVFRPAPRSGNLNIGLLCYFHPCKRVYEAILVFHKLRQQGCRATLHLAGARLHGPTLDEYYVACRRLVKALQLEDAVSFYGHVSNPAEWLRSIDIFVSNSYWEGQQVALLEALASGCYCLSHAWMGADEVLPQQFLYWTDDELLSKIEAYAKLSESERQALHGFMNRLACEKFDFAQQKRRIRNIIEGAVPKERRPDVRKRS